MQPIISPEEAEKKRRKNVAILSGVMLAILVLGTAGYAFLSSTVQTEQDQGTQITEVTNLGNQWAVPINNQVFYFKNSPEQVKDIPLDITTNVATYANTILAIDSTNNAVTAEIESTLGRYATRVQEVCVGACERNLPEKNCSQPIIIWRDAVEQRVYQDESCVVIEGDMRAVDRFLYAILNVN